MRTILVTGGTGTLGRPTVAHLRAAGHQVRVLSRKPGSDLATNDLATGDLVTGDLNTGEGLTEAVEGADVVVHLATSRRSADVAQTQNLVRVVEAAGTRHLVVISIVGIDEIPMGYYRAKLEIERLVAASEIPFTLLRATQFHNLLDEIFAAQRFLPLLLAPAITLQPIAVENVAERLTELASGEPAGRVPDIGGPERLAVPDLARAWTQAKHSRRPVVPLKLPGKIFRGYASGEALVPGTPYGRRTFADFLVDRYGVKA
jgi:uncharacterized protein YbjT (DUF2867 family)